MFIVETIDISLTIKLILIKGLLFSEVLFEHSRNTHKLFAINATKSNVEVSLFKDKNFIDNWEILKEDNMRPIEFLVPAAAQLKKMNIFHIAKEGNIQLYLLRRP